MTSNELSEWRYNFQEHLWENADQTKVKKNYDGRNMIYIDGVTFWHSKDIKSIDFSYKKMFGFLSTDNGMYANNNYYPILNGILCRDMFGTVRSEDVSFEGMAQAIKEYWENFIT